MANDFDLSDADARDLTDAARRATGQAPLPRTAAQGVADMQERIRQLTVQKSRLLELMHLPSDLDSQLATLNRELADCQQRLKEYEHQRAGKN